MSMWYDNKSCFYSLIREDKEETMYCFYDFVKTGVLSKPFRCCEKDCPIVHPELLKKKIND